VARINWAKLFLDVDSRGNRLENADVSQSDDGRHLYLDLLCCDDVAEQFWMVLADRNPRWLETDEEWTHCLRFDGPYGEWLDDLIELLKTVLTLNAPSQLDVALALDFYQVPPDEQNPEWTKTPTGLLVYRKYFKPEYPNSRDSVRTAGFRLTKKLAEVITRHPLFQTASLIIVVPSTTNPWKFGEVLGRSVAKRVGLDYATAQCLSPDHRQAKEGHLSAGVEPYRIDSDITDQGVIIVDDIYRTGQTIRDIGHAAREQGASEVLALVGTRTMRN
jgi:hypothetical protein